MEMALTDGLKRDYGCSWQSVTPISKERQEKEEIWAGLYQKRGKAEIIAEGQGGNLHSGPKRRDLLCLTTAQKEEKDENEWIETGGNYYDGHDARELTCTGKNLLF